MTLKALKAKAKNNIWSIRLATCVRLLNNARIAADVKKDSSVICTSNFDCAKFSDKVIKYIDSNRGERAHLYRFSGSTQICDLYSSVYALITFALLGKLDIFSDSEIEDWRQYILSFQRPDGKFIDNSLDSYLSDKAHHWGWYHLLPHVIIALDYLQIKPKHSFSFINNEILFNNDVDTWLSSRRWKDDYLGVSNEIMNVTVALQYSRDVFNCVRSANLVTQILQWLKINQIDSVTGLWGTHTSRSRLDICRSVKTAYHIVPMYIYDDEFEDLNIDQILKYSLLTQNKIGTYSLSYLADACEDMDSLYLLSQLPVPEHYQPTVNKSINTFLRQVFMNMNADGGFVFKRNRKFQYADSKLVSARNESNMFATWFRTLSIAYACESLKITNKHFRFSNVPGYQYSKKATRT